jgi:hypothetical protein
LLLILLMVSLITEFTLSEGQLPAYLASTEEETDFEKEITTAMGDLVSKARLETVIGEFHDQTDNVKK